MATKIAWLVSLQIVNHGPALAAIAFASRALGPAAFGQYARLLSFAAIITLLVDYGFNLTGVKAAARASSAREDLSRVFSSVMGAKLVMAAAVISALLVTAAVGLRNLPFLALGAAVLIQGIALGLTPSWLFIGVQRVDKLLLPFAVSRVSAAIAVALFVNNQSDLVLFACINLLFALVLMVWTWKRAGLVGAIWTRPSRGAVQLALKESTAVFGASLAINTYTASGPLVVGFALGNEATGQYALADRVRQLVLGAVGPVSQAVFPVACRAASGNSAKDVMLFRRGAALVLILGAAAAILLFAFAEPIVRLLGGERFLGAVEVLRIIAVLAFAVTLSGVLGTHVLVAHGFNTDLAMIATVVAVVGVPLLYFVSRIYGLQGAAAALVMTELLAVVALLAACWKRNLLKSMLGRH